MAIKRLTLSDVQNLGVNDINRATRDELSRYVRVLADVANKRITRLTSQPEEIRIESEALQAVLRGGNRGQGRFTTANKNRNQLLAEFTRVQSFLAGKTSTVKGTKASIRQRKQGPLGFLYNQPVSYRREFWEILADIKERNPLLYRLLGSEQVQEMVEEHIEKRLDNGEKQDVLETSREVISEMNKRQHSPDKLEPFFHASNWEDELPL